MAAVCVNTKTHFGLKQIIVYHVHETTLIVLLGLCLLPCNLCATDHELFTLAGKRTLLHSFRKWGICGDTLSPRRASSPVLGFEVSTVARLLSQRFPNFPRAHSDPFSSLELRNRLPGQHIRGVILTSNFLYP